MGQEEAGVTDLEVIEICAGAGGQALGLERAGFEHALAVELDPVRLRHAAGQPAGLEGGPGRRREPGGLGTGGLRGSGPARGRRALPAVHRWPAGSSGATDERDLFAWAVELCGRLQPRALLLENVRGLSMNRFGAYRQHVLDRLRELGYVPGWKLLNASDFGVPQLRPGPCWSRCAPRTLPGSAGPRRPRSARRPWARPSAT